MQYNHYALSNSLSRLNCLGDLKLNILRITIITDFIIETILDSKMEKAPRLFFLTNEDISRLSITIEPVINVPCCKKVIVYIEVCFKLICLL